jgi:hypothetical protein
MARFAGSFSAAGATNTEGCSAQYEENSTKDVDDRMKGGAVMEARSPLNDAMDFKNEVHEPLDCGGTAEPSSFELDLLLPFQLMVSSRNDRCGILCSRES